MDKTLQKDFINDSKRKIFVVDTSVLLYDKNSIFNMNGNNIVIPLVVLEEIDKFCNAFIKIKKEINLVESAKFDKIDNPLKNAPHTYIELASTEWKHVYSREEAAFPTEYVKNNKYWAPVARVDNVFGDRNLVCSCPTMDEYKDEAA